MEQHLDPTRCMALFVADVSSTEPFDAGAVRDTVEHTLRRYGEDGCYARAAEVFGDRPEVAERRIRWARASVAQAYDAMSV